MEKKTQQQPREEPLEEQGAKTRRGRLWRWTEFGEKTGWEWIQLLIIPVVIGVAGLWFNRKQDERQREDAQTRAQAQLEAEEERTQERGLTSPPRRGSASFLGVSRGHDTFRRIKGRGRGGKNPLYP